MTIEEKSKALMEWLEANQGEAPPADVAPEVIEAVYALRPDLAPRPSVDLSMILDKIDSGPFATNRDEIDKDKDNLISLAGARKRNKIWSSIGLVAAAAMVLIVVVPLRDNEAVTRAPLTMETAPTSEPMSAEVELDVLEEEVIDIDDRLMEALSVSDATESPSNQPLQASPSRDGSAEPTTANEVQSVSVLDLTPPTSRAGSQHLDFNGLKTEVQSRPDDPPSPPATVEPLDDSLYEISEVVVFDGLLDGGLEETQGIVGGADDDPIGAAAEIEFDQPSAPIGSVSSSNGLGASGSGYGGGGMSTRRSRAQASEGRRVESAPSEDAGDAPREAEAEEDSVISSGDDTRAREMIQGEIEIIEELILSYNFEEALVITRLGRVAAATYPDLLKLLWIQESQALTGLGRLDEAEEARAEAEKL